MLGDMTTTLPHYAEELTGLVNGVRAAVTVHADWVVTAQLVAEELRAHLPRPEALPAEQRLGSPDDCVVHTLYVEPDGSFSITALVCRPGQRTRIHDHVTWCVLGVIQGLEREELFDPDLNLTSRHDHPVGYVSAFGPPGDIHRVHNAGETTTISIHIYGTDITRLGSGARRYYD
jgi:predicted metal-dependent enzyme (double-stranded beta helix superfamily)